MERNSSVKHAQVWAVQGWMTSWEEGHGVEKNSRMKGAKLGQYKDGSDPSFLILPFKDLFLSFLGCE